MSVYTDGNAGEADEEIKRAEHQKPNQRSLTRLLQTVPRVWRQFVGHGVGRFNFFFDSSPFLYEIACEYMGSVVHSKATSTCSHQSSMPRDQHTRAGCDLPLGRPTEVHCVQKVTGQSRVERTFSPRSAAFPGFPLPFPLC